MTLISGACILHGPSPWVAQVGKLKPVGLLGHRKSVPILQLKWVNVKVVQLIQRPLVKELHCRGAQVWHAFSRDFTVLPAHPRIYPRMLEPYLPLLFQLKLVLGWPHVSLSVIGDRACQRARPHRAWSVRRGWVGLCVGPRSQQTRSQLAAGSCRVRPRLCQHHRREQQARGSGT